MDTTETYIKMCDWKDLQFGGIFQGDYYTLNRNNLAFHYPPNECVGDYLKPKIWTDTIAIKNIFFIKLFKQDQIQEMIGLPLPELYYAFEKFIKTYPIEYMDGVFSKFTSMEQLWLAFLMHEKYGKKWSGKKWEEI